MLKLVRQHKVRIYFSFYFIKYIQILKTSVINVVDLSKYTNPARQVKSDNIQFEFYMKKGLQLAATSYNSVWYTISSLM